jgi:hypothetical protein
MVYMGRVLEETTENALGALFRTPENRTRKSKKDCEVQRTPRTDAPQFSGAVRRRRLAIIGAMAVPFFLCIAAAYSTRLRPAPAIVVRWVTRWTRALKSG